jgi:hypothetical protein
MIRAYVKNHPPSCSGCPACSDRLAELLADRDPVSLSRRLVAANERHHRALAAQRTTPDDVPAPPRLSDLFHLKADHPAVLVTAAADDPDAVPPPPKLMDLFAYRRK